MGNQTSSPRHSTSSEAKGRRGHETAERVKRMVGDVGQEIKRSVQRLEEDPPQFLDSVCGGWPGDDRSVASSKYHRSRRQYSAYSEDDYTEDGSRTLSEDETTYDDRSRRSRADHTVESQSYVSQSEYGDTEDERTEASSAMGPASHPTSALQKQPLASSFAKRCYFTKAGIGRATQHYEGLTLTGNVVLMLASAMKLKGCPTICDEDLRRVEQTYPNQFSRLPDELLLSSGWRRISKYCHFSNKPVPDGVPFFHSKQRLHPSGGYYFLLAAAVGMSRSIDVEPLTKDTLVLLETDYPTQCDSAPSILVQDHQQWTLVDKFCFFSGGPINTEEDVYYQADFDGNPIFMLAFLSPSLTPDELYKLGEQGEPSLKTVAAVQEVESVYDLTERDFDDLKLYHLGPCRALPQYILSPQAWVKVLPPHFLAARQQAFIRAEDYMQRHGIAMDETNGYQQQSASNHAFPESESDTLQYQDKADSIPLSPGLAAEFQRDVDEEGAFYDDSLPVDEQDGILPEAQERHDLDIPHFMDGGRVYDDPTTPKIEPPEEEPPRLQKASTELAPVGQVPDPVDLSDVMTPATTTGPYSTGRGSSPFSQPQQFGNERSESIHDPQIAATQSSHDYNQFSSIHAMQVSSELGPRETFFQEFDDGDRTSRENVGDALHAQHNASKGIHPSASAASGQDASNPVIGHQSSQDSGLKSGEEDFIPIKRDGYQLGQQAIISPSGGDSVGSHKSVAFRNAQELLRKNRRKRQEEVSQQGQAGSEHLGRPPLDLQANGTWDSTSDVSGSNVSGSSVWSDNSAGDRSSRRALILQMAKARMRNNKDSPTKSLTPPDRLQPAMIEEEGASVGGTEIDIASDLD